MPPEIHFGVPPGALFALDRNTRRNKNCSHADDRARRKKPAPGGWRSHARRMARRAARGDFTQFVHLPRRGESPGEGRRTREVRRHRPGGGPAIRRRGRRQDSRDGFRRGAPFGRTDGVLAGDRARTLPLGGRGRWGGGLHAPLLARRRSGRGGSASPRSLSRRSPPQLSGSRIPRSALSFRGRFLGA